MRFTSVGPKWRAALRSSLSPPPLSPSYSHAPFVFLPSQIPPPPVPLPAFARPRYISLSFSSPAAQHGRLQECTKCTVLTDARPCSTASTCLLRPFSFTSPCSSSLLPARFPAFHPPPPHSVSVGRSSPVSLCRSFCPSRSRFFITFFFDRLLRLRGSLSHPLRRSAAAALPLPRNPLLYHCVMLLPHVRACKHTYTHVCMCMHESVRERSTLSLSNIGSCITVRAFSLRSLTTVLFFLFSISLALS